MKEISYYGVIGKGKTFKVNDESYEEVNKYKWFLGNGRNNYPMANIRYSDGKIRNTHLHKLLMKPPKGMQVDHIDGDKSNCQLNNLRIATNQQNQMNRKKTIGTSSKYKGVHWYTRHQLWSAAIHFNYKKIFLGYFSNERKAAKAYDTKAKELYGEFAKLNLG